MGQKIKVEKAGNLPTGGERALGYKILTTATTKRTPPRECSELTLNTTTGLEFFITGRFAVSYMDFTYIVSKRLSRT